MEVMFYISLTALLVSVCATTLGLLLRKRSPLIQEAVTKTPWHKDPTARSWPRRPIKHGAFRFFDYQKNFMTYSTRVDLDESVDAVEAVHGLKKGDPTIIYFAMRFFGIAGAVVFSTLTVGFAMIYFDKNQKGWIVVGLAIFLS